jgi:acetoin utilization deacetylase AcuC-like enzyme
MHDRGAGAAFLPPHEFLPNEPWDRSERVTSLYHLLIHVPSLVYIVEDFEPVAAEVLLDFHQEAYVRSLGLLNGQRSNGFADAGLFAVGAVRALCERVWMRQLANAYALVRPAGHHADAGAAGGGCMFANGVLAALHAKELGARRILFVDWDAHHGNSQQGAFWRDPSVLTISIHQGRAYPPQTGGLDARGAGAGFGSNINVPVPLGSGGGVYRAVFESVVLPAADRFQPDFVIVSSGLDGNYIDPSARLSLHSQDYKWLTQQVMTIAAEYAGGRLLLTHEGGYALPYIPLCFLAILEALTGKTSEILDPFLLRWGTDFASAVSSEAATIISTGAAFVDTVPLPS